MIVVTVIILILTSLTDAVCPVGNYGNDCKLICGRCAGNSSCDSTSGICTSGCEKGWRKNFCNTSYPLLRDAPTLTHQTEGIITVSWRRWTNAKDFGEGTPQFYLIQIRNSSTHFWNTVHRVSATDWLEKNDGFEVTLYNLTFPVVHFLRVVVVDQSGESQLNRVPVLQLPASTLSTSSIIPNMIGNQTVHDNDHSDDDNSSFQNVVTQWLTWIGIAAGSAFIVAIILVIIFECCCKKRQKEKPAGSSLHSGTLNTSVNNENFSEDGYENTAYVTIRLENARNKNGNLHSDEPVNKVDWSGKVQTNTLGTTGRSNKRVSSLHQHGRWKEAVPGLRQSRAVRDSTGSWYTEWYDSRIYENQREAPEELTIDQTRDMRTLPI